MALFRNIDPAELHRRLRAGEAFRLIDVREPEEWETARLGGAELMPLSQAAEWMPGFDPGGDPCVVYCHHGVRSARVCALLAKQGAAGLLNLAGGIDRWSRDVDPGVARY